MTRWLTLTQIGREMSLSPAMALKHLRKIAFAYPMQQRQNQNVWDARCLDLLRAMRNQPHRTLEPAHSDWLATYLKEQSDASTAP